MVRSAEGEQTHKDTLYYLFESEYEVAGLMFALAGCLVYELQETLPSSALDSLKPPHLDRIAALVECSSEDVEYLTVALLLKDPAVLNGSHQHTTEI